MFLLVLPFLNSLESERRGPRLTALAIPRRPRRLLPLAEGALAVARQQFLVEGEQPLVEGVVAVPQLCCNGGGSEFGAIAKFQNWARGSVHRSPL